MNVMPSTNSPLNEYFTIRQVSQLFGRSEYAIWYHTKHNVKPPPQQKGMNILLTRQNLVDLVMSGHIRLREGETKEGLLAKVKEAVAA